MLGTVSAPQARGFSFARGWVVARFLINSRHSRKFAAKKVFAFPVTRCLWPVAYTLCNSLQTHPRPPLPSTPQHP
jgi:hypothetical protein